MIAQTSATLSTHGIPHSMADHTLLVFVHGGAIVVRETEYGSIAVIYPRGQYIGGTVDNAVNHVLWLLSDEFEAIAETGAVYHLPESKRVYTPFLMLLGVFVPLLAIAAVGL
jgi:hypothetical protein